ncbi:hypothetical protein OP10G_3800 [Fimbriimonas ginsengisoli Gsoil 348]|uniref:DUF3303 domain-containing protein n=2 Tax=Fimbriimonas ginsengisoli TaxID=1005039 RepID=A0A068NUG4_FIMGI|nr:hypothetical protein OP10G_3800 [Fimbriimonas ginsengisoli Gsoil 348]
MVIETFKAGLKPVGERFARSGRMLPDNVSYIASWMESSGARCFQIMEAPNVKALTPWLDFWGDIVEFEVVPVQTSADFWAARKG